MDFLWFLGLLWPLIIQLFKRTSSKLTSEIATDGDKSMPPRNVPLCHVGYFELQTVEAQTTWEEILTSALTVPKNLDRGLAHEESYHQRQVQRVWARCGRLGRARQGLYVESPLYALLSPIGSASICLPNICLSHLPGNCPSSL